MTDSDPELYVCEIKGWREPLIVRKEKLDELLSGKDDLTVVIKSRPATAEEKKAFEKEEEFIELFLANNQRLPPSLDFVKRFAKSKTLRY